jgi:hypothetical protein
MPGMPYLELKGSIVTKGHKIKGSAPTLFDTRNARRLVDNFNDPLSPYALYQLLRGFSPPDQEFVYCYKANRDLLLQYSRLPDCAGFQTNPTRRIGKNSVGKVRANLRYFSYLFFLLSNNPSAVLFSSAGNSTKKLGSKTPTSTKTTAGASSELAIFPTIPASRWLRGWPFPATATLRPILPTSELVTTRTTTSKRPSLALRCPRKRRFLRARRWPQKWQK